jgi:hypothetical protein
MQTGHTISTNVFRSRSVFAVPAHLFIFAFVFLFAFSLQADPQGKKLQAPAEPIPNDFFGLHIHHLWKPTEWPDVTFGTWRLWDAHVTWALLEPRRGAYDFGLLDRYVEAAESRHIQIVLTLAGTPTWASARPDEIPVHEGGSKGSPGSAAEPDSLASWQDFVRAVGLHYKGKIHYYEMWNEPMFKPFYSGTVPQMIEMVRTARATLKEIDPDVQILSPPVDGSPAGVRWLKEFLESGGGDLIDIYGFHLYVPGPPELMVEKVETFQRILGSHNENAKPIWNTEAGWQMKTREPQMGANFVARSFLVAWPLGVKRYMYYSWDNDTMGIMPKGSRSEMAEAYRKISQWLVGATMSDCVVSPDGTWVEHVTRPDGQRAKIIWNPSGEKRLSQDHIANASSYETLTGRNIPVRDGTEISVGGSPILLLYPKGNE